MMSNVICDIHRNFTINNNVTTTPTSSPGPARSSSLVIISIHFARTKSSKTTVAGRDGTLMYMGSDCPAHMLAYVWAI